MEKLKQQHWEILSSCDSLEKFCKEGINNSEDIEKYMGEQSNAVFHIKKFKKILVEHLKLENKELYPILINGKDSKSKKIAKKYSDEMELISKKAISFFEKYAHLKVDDISQNEDFKLDLNLVIKIIRKRIDVEEEKLYPLYNKIKK